MTSAEFGKFIADETEKWGKVIRAANIKAGSDVTTAVFAAVRQTEFMEYRSSGGQRHSHLGGRIPRRTDAVPRTRFVARHRFTHGRVTDVAGRPSLTLSGLERLTFAAMHGRDLL
jgi:hypothetical protein